MTDEILDCSAAELGIVLPDEKLIVAASEIVDGKDRVRALYQLSLRYRELAHEALMKAQRAASDTNAEGITFREIADHAGCKSVGSLARSRSASTPRWR